MTTNISRRNFLKHSGAMGAVATVGVPLVMNLLPKEANAAGFDDYKALVCVFLAGGNDAFNTVVRTDTVAGLDRYAAARATIQLGRTYLTTPASQLNLSGCNFTGTSGLGLALHPRMTRLRDMFNAVNASNGARSNRLALIGNIGPLVKTMTASAYRAGSADVPPKLFSHNDQTSVWQSGKPEGATAGWGGELVRRVDDNNTVSGAASTLFSAVSVEASAVFCSGSGVGKLPGEASVQPAVNLFGASKGGVLRPGGGNVDSAAWGNSPLDVNGFRWGQVSREAVLKKIFEGTAGSSNIGAGKHFIEQDYLSKLASANVAWSAMAEASAVAGTVPAAPANNDLAKQLEVVGNFIRARVAKPSSMKSTRQVFFVQIGGFDTHSGQNAGGAHDNLLGQVDEALAYFYQMLSASGDLDKVTTFTASEFGRKLNENGDGTDHGWGGHHFVMGGAVKTGVYGQFPDLGTWTGSSYTDPQLLSDGTMVPKVAVDQLAKELGQWLGVNWSTADNAELARQIFPTEASPLPMLGFTA